MATAPVKVGNVTGFAIAQEIKPPAVLPQGNYYMVKAVAPARVAAVRGYYLAQEVKNVLVRQVAGFVLTRDFDRYQMPSEPIPMLIDQINRVSDGRFTPDNATLDLPVVDPLGTKVTVRAARGSRLQGSYDVYYSRVSLAALLGQRQNLSDPVEQVSSMEELLAQVNARFTLKLTVDDLVPIEDWENFNGYYELVASDISYMLIPGTRVLFGPTADLGALMKVKDFTGFTPA